MRFIVRALLCAGLLAALAGCDPTDKHYFTQGVGTKLAADDVATQTDIQNLYVADVCRQAGLQPSPADAAAICGNNDPASWWLFVQAGMNDIDQRCDAYLTWLDNVRRSREPILNQISQTRSATETIMTLTGVGTGPINIVGSAFGLASNTFTNINSRLIMEVPHSTVQAVVLSHQKQYRDELIGNAADRPRVIIASRPAAIFALRSYLRLCMPMTIETLINNTVTTIARGGTEALENAPLISATSVGVPLRAMQPVAKPVRVVTPTVPAFATLFVNYTPAQFPPSVVKRIQAGLCVPASEQGTVGVFTPNLISIYEQATRQELTGRLNNRDVGEILSPPSPSIPCSSTGAKNYYERITYTDGAQVAALVKRLNRSTAGGPLDEKATLAQARTKIRAVRGALAGNLTLQLPDAMADQMTSDLDTALFNAH